MEKCSLPAEEVGYEVISGFDVQHAAPTQLHSRTCQIPQNTDHMALINVKRLSRPCCNLAWSSTLCLFGLIADTARKKRARSNMNEHSTLCSQVRQLGRLENKDMDANRYIKRQTVGLSVEVSTGQNLYVSRVTRVQNPAWRSRLLLAWFT